MFIFKIIIIYFKLYFYKRANSYEKKGECDLAIIEKVISDIALFSNTRKTIIIKSTVPVGFTKKNSLKYNNLDFVFNPEFLTEANYIDDFKNQKFIILAGEKRFVVK